MSPCLRVQLDRDVVGAHLADVRHRDGLLAGAKHSSIVRLDVSAFGGVRWLN